MEGTDTVGIYDIPAGTENWDVPLNANLDAIDGRLTNGENKNTTQDGQIATLQGNVASNTADIATNASNIAAVTTTANGAVPKDAQIVNVKDHGATGNGTTDDTAAINNAISVMTTGGVLYFPPGNYLLNGSTSINANLSMTIRGAGPGSTAIRYGASFSAAQLISVSTNDVTIEDIQIRGDIATTTSNPVTTGVNATGVQTFKMFNVEMQWINGYAVKAFGTAGQTLHGGQLDNIKIQSCAGGIWVKSDNTATAANFQMSNIFTRFLGVNSGGSANLDGIRIEDSWDVLAQNIFAWMNATTGGTGVALRVVGNCAATFITNLDALGPQTGSANVSIEGNANGSPQNVQITGGVIQQGIVGLNIQDAATQVRVVSVRFINNQTHGVTVSSTGPAIYFEGCFFSQSGQGATGTNYDLNWSGTTTGFVTNCRFASPIVSTGTAGVQQSVNVTAGQNVRFLNADFQGTGAAQANWFTNLPAAAHTVTGGNSAFLTNTDFNYSTGPGRVSIMPFAAGNNCLATNVQGTDANDRFRLTGDGGMAWGPGTAARDVTLTRASAGQLRVTPSTNASNSTSVGGALNVTNTSSTGAGIVVYSNQAAPTGHLIVSRADNAAFNQAAIYAENHGTSHAISVNQQGTGANSAGLNVSSTNASNSAVWFTGAETGRGTLKITHNVNGGDASASAISIDNTGTGTAAMGIFMTSTTGGTTGDLLHFRNGGTGALFNVTSAGVIGLGSGTGAVDTTLTRTAAGALNTNGTFTVGSNNAKGLNLNTIGGGISIKEGTNARMGIAPLNGTTAVTIANTSVTAGTRVFLTINNPGGTVGSPYVSGRVAGTSFDVKSTTAGDTSTVAWMLVEPN